MRSDVPAQDYFEPLVEDSQWLKAMPFEHTLRRVPHRYFVERLCQERRLLAHEAFARTPAVVLVVYCDKSVERFRDTLESCLLQSGLRFTVVFRASHPSTRQALQQALVARLQGSGLECAFGGRIVFADSLEEALRKYGQSSYYVFARSGDVFDPALVTCLALECQRPAGQADLYLWYDLLMERSPTPRAIAMVRKPQVEPYSLWHVNYVSYDFAVRGSLLADPDDVEALLAGNDAHLYLLGALRAGHTKWVTIPRPLLLKDARHIAPGRALVEPYLDRYRDYFQNHPVHFDTTPGPNAYRLVPQVPVQSVSVIILFRDKPELTMQAIQSVRRQRALPASVEFILVDNQSRDASVDLVMGFARTVETERIRFTLLQYDKPFNHSAQCNLAVRQARGEVLVILNNDAVLLSSDALSLMAKWSLFPGIGTVGVRMVDQAGQLVSAGVVLRLRSGRDLESMAEESQDAMFAGCDRETWGNSFACLAMSKQTFDKIGPLDEVMFPNGYNDVEFNVRCKQAGLVNMYLGSQTVIHKPATSRGLSDEICQKLELRRRYPELARDSLFQVLCEDYRRPHRRSPISLGVILSWGKRRLSNLLRVRIGLRREGGRHGETGAGARIGGVESAVPPEVVPQLPFRSRPSDDTGAVHS